MRFKITSVENNTLYSRMTRVVGEKDRAGVRSASNGVGLNPLALTFVVFRR